MLFRSVRLSTLTIHHPHPQSASCSCRAPLPRRKFSSFLYESRSYSSCKAPCPPDCPCQIHSQRAFCAPPELPQGCRHVHVGPECLGQFHAHRQNSSVLSDSMKQVPWRIPPPASTVLIVFLCYHHHSP